VALRHIHELENLMSNEIKSGNSGSGTNDPNRMNDATKSGQQSQGTTPQSDKSASQQGGSDQKSGQQSQGGTQKDSDGTKQAGSSNVSNDVNKGNDAGQKTASSNK
jgi:general stress protein YciG